MTSEFKTASGRTIYLHEISQRATYEGMIEGLPTVEKNKQLIKHLLAQSQWSQYGVDPLLLPQREERIELPVGEEYPFGTPSALPSVTCIARFESLTPTRGGTGDFSGLVVLWFQSEFGFPPPGDIQEQLRLIPWDEKAGNYVY